MIMLILNDEQMLDLEEMNAAAPPDRKLEPVRLPDGRYGLDAELLMICDPGEPWWQFRTLLLNLPAETINRLAPAN
jgi:hypothetical protein